ncbi:MAG: MBL fold metallo-hydrolase [Firmicutes bacterium]|nr:MBL fold metallo-hydrolase [Bacillota bacterium]
MLYNFSKTVYNGGMLRCCTIASGSQGNCMLLCSQKTKIVVDMGIPIKRLEQSLLSFGLTPRDLDAVFVTHIHTDHIKGLPALSKKYNTKIFCHQSIKSHLVAYCVKHKHFVPNIVVFEGDDFFLGAFTVSTFFVPHDAHCTGFCFLCEGNKVAYATDMGCLEEGIIEKMSGADLAIVESNHDPKLLLECDYPSATKQRILSRGGHLSNGDCASLVLALAKTGTTHFILAHLSRNANYSELAFDCTHNHLRANGFVEGKDVHIVMAQQDSTSTVLELY